MDYHVVDVFTTTPLQGNGLAVFPDGTGLETAMMQAIARELNLSETTFILPQESNADATRVRIFTPARELAFAGHPTIGTAYVMRRLGLVADSAKRFVLSENVGPVPVRVDEGDDPILWLTTPQISWLGAFARDRCAATLTLGEERLVPSVPCEQLTAGSPLIIIPLRDREAVDAAQLDARAYAQLVNECTEPTAVFLFAATPEGAYSRMFAPEFGIVEDPATGGATGPLAAFMMKHGLASSKNGTRFISEQGVKMGRRSVLHVLINGENGQSGVEIGGNVVHVAEATMHLP
ncbi:MAG TPA: PhzF family phenazine biosynthesis protein [Candidatus Nitrosotalea sp.]|nr:PhzF family phenazine biosynthesis protein [Candidatus Nitrosotalea sp.]